MLDIIRFFLIFFEKCGTLFKLLGNDCKLVSLKLNIKKWRSIYFPE